MEYSGSEYSRSEYSGSEHSGSEYRRRTPLYELKLEADSGNLPVLQAFIEDHLEAAGCPMKKIPQISMAAEEVFINISSYAYAPSKGDATICMEFVDRPASVIITFKDHGIPYDPLAKADPDVSLPAEQRKIGGLGIFLTKQVMDDIAYKYKDGQNILTMRKSII